MRQSGRASPGGGIAGRTFEAEADGADRPSSPVVDRREAERVRVLGRMPTELLAAELQRRGWIVVEP